MLTRSEEASIKTLNDLIDGAKATIDLIQGGYMKEIRHSEYYLPRNVYLIRHFLVVNLNMSDYSD